MKTTLTCLFLFITIISCLNVSAQKKVTPVTQSVLTGIALPAGTKQDKRWLSENTAKVLLELESRKAKTGVKDPEVLYLPSASSCGFNTDSLVAQLSGLGWEIIPVAGDEKFAWLKKNDRYLIAYFLMEEKQTQLYIAESTAVPAL